MKIKPVHCDVVHEHKMGGELVLVGKGDGGQVGGLGTHTEPGLAGGGGDDMGLRGGTLNPEAIGHSCFNITEKRENYSTRLIQHDFGLYKKKRKNNVLQ